MRLARSKRRAQTTWLPARRSSSRMVIRSRLRSRWIVPSRRKSIPNVRRIAASSRDSATNRREGTARNHEQPTESGQCGGDLVGESGRKVRLLLRRPDELKRQDANLRAAPAWRRAPRFVRPAKWHALPGQMKSSPLASAGRVGAGCGRGGAFAPGPRISASSRCVSTEGAASSMSARTARQRS